MILKRIFVTRRMKTWNINSINTPISQHKMMACESWNTSMMGNQWEQWEIDIFDKYKLDDPFQLHHRAHITRQKQKRLRICFSVLCNYYNFNFDEKRRGFCCNNRKLLFMNPTPGLNCQKYRSKFGTSICVWETCDDRPSCPRCYAAQFYPRKYRGYDSCNHVRTDWINVI